MKITILCELIFLWGARISNYCSTATKTYLRTNNFLKMEKFHEIFSIIFFLCLFHYLVKVLASNLARFFLKFVIGLELRLLKQLALTILP